MVEPPAILDPSKWLGNVMEGGDSGIENILDPLFNMKVGDAIIVITLMVALFIYMLYKHKGSYYR